MRLSRELNKTITEELNRHFDVHTKRPKIRVCGPQEFFNYFTGKKKRRSIRELTKLDVEVSCFFDEETDTVVFKSFRQDGQFNFKSIKDKPINFTHLVHECIHHVQVVTGGYGLYDAFEEGFCEISTFVLTGDIDRESSYWDYIIPLWNMMDAITEDPFEKYNLIRQYNASENKQALHNTWLSAFIKRFPRIATGRKNLARQLEGEITPSLTFVRISQRKERNEIIRELYQIRDSLKPQLGKAFR